MAVNPTPYTSRPSTIPDPPLFRTEEQLSASAVIWDPMRHEWVAEDEPLAESLQTIAAPLEGQDKELEKGVEELTKDLIWVEWEEGDKDNPYNFSKRRKWTTTWILCLFTMVLGIAGTSLASGNESLMADLDCSRELATWSLGAFSLGFGVAPLVLAPCSEAFGRYQMYVYSSIIYVILTVPIARAKNVATVIVFRLLAGLAASTGSTLVGGTISDLFDSNSRGRAMSLFSFMAFVGTGAGPASMGYVAEKLGWRWIQYFNLILGALSALSILLFTSETRGSVILSRRAKRLRTELKDERYRCRADAERASLVVLIKVSLTRPLYLLCTEPIVTAISLWVGFCWGCLFLSLEAVGLVFSEVYGFTTGEAGLVFIAVLVAAVLGFGTSIFQDMLYQKHVGKRGPEARLYTSCVGGVLFSGGLFMFAFSQGRTHWVVPASALVLIFWAIYSIFLAVFSYLADVYTTYASSALSGQSLFRNVSGAIYPLFTFQLYNGLGFTYASLLAACLALVLSLVPFVLVLKGPTIRGRSKFANQLEKMQLPTKDDSVVDEEVKDAAV